MKLAYTVKGGVYHKHKVKFKQKMRDFGLRWVGDFNNPKWESNVESLTAHFVRNAENTFTVEAQLIWEGEEKTDFYQFFKDFCEHFKGVLMEGETNLKKVSNTDLLMFDMVFKPNVKQMKKENCPQKFIDLAMADYEKERKKMLGDG